MWYKFTFYISLIIGHLHDDFILLQQPESFRVLLSCANWGFCSLNLAGTTKFQYEKRSKKDSGCSRKMTPLFKWPIVSRSQSLVVLMIIRNKKVFSHVKRKKANLVLWNVISSPTLYPFKTVLTVLICAGYFIIAQSQSMSLFMNQLEASSPLMCKFFLCLYNNYYAAYK